MLSLEYLQKLKRSPALQELEWYRCKEDPKHFIFNWLKTLDSDDPENKVFKNFPRKKYIEIVIDKWLEHQVLFVPKSRQHMWSWIFVWLYLWLAQFRKWKLVFFQSKKEDDAIDLVNRAKILYESEPDFLKRYYENWKYIELKQWQTKKKQESSAKLSFPAIKSEIRWVPQWRDQVRMQTLSWLLMDEAAFQTEAEWAFEAALPAIGKTWKVTLLSTALANTFFEKACFDEIEDE